MSARTTRVTRIARLVRRGPVAVPRTSAPWLDRTGVVGVVLTAGVLLIAVLAPLLAPYGAMERVAAPYGRPSAAHLLGTDDLGRDLMSQVLLGARTSVTVALGVAAMATTIATFVGGLAAVRGGWVDGALMRLADVVLTLPFLPVVVLAAAFVGTTTGERIVVIAALTWAGAARVVRSGALTALSRPHVEVARTMGAGSMWILVRHASYVAGPLLLPIAVRSAAGAVGLDAALAFLGLGDPTTTSWGTILYWAQVRGAFLGDSWLWWALPPGLALTVLVLGLALIGVSAERRLNPVLER